MIPKFVVVIGGSGSGKNHYIANHPEYSGYKLIDIDPARGEVATGKLDDRIAAMKSDLELSLSRGMNIAHPTTGAGTKGLENKLKLAAEYGYENILVLIDTDPRVAEKNIETRVASGGHGGIPSWKIEKTNAAARSSYEELKNSPHVSRAEVVSGRKMSESLHLLRRVIAESISLRLGDRWIP